MRQSLTFECILEALVAPNRRRVLERAVLANRLAKLAATAPARRRAYRVKTSAIEHGIRKFPGAFGLASVEHDGRVLGIRFRRERALHVIAGRLSPASREWVAREIREISAAAAAARQPARAGGRARTAAAPHAAMARAGGGRRSEAA